jgi:hypothetical protein
MFMHVGEWVRIRAVVKHPESPDGTLGPPTQCPATQLAMDAPLTVGSGTRPHPKRTSRRAGGEVVSELVPETPVLRKSLTVSCETGQALLTIVSESIVNLCS